MPEISRFYGLILYLNFRDHNPPHVHAKYGDFEATITIEDGIIKGEMPRRALNMVFEWMELHKSELLTEFNNAQNGLPIKNIEPLK